MSNSADVLSKRHASAELIQQGKKPKRRSELPLSHIEWCREDLIFFEEGTAELRTLTRSTVLDKSTLSLLLNTGKVKHLVFADRDALENGRELLPLNYRMLVDAEVENDLPGFSMIITRDLGRIWWAPIEEEPTIAQWANWLQTYSANLVNHVIQFHRFVPVKGREFYKPYSDDLMVIRFIQQQSVYEANTVYSGLLPKLVNGKASRAAQDPMLRSTANEESDAVTIDRRGFTNGAMVHDGRHQLWSVHDGLPFLGTFLEGRCLNPKVAGLNAHVAADPRPLFDLWLDEHFSTGRVKRRSAPLDLLC